ncbi:MAG: hypothetical protein CSA62_02145 [Planctomycetota bacterium]|nr:MAG: hypothetical protein CSA62_02145 [Planctomycetota bacterium]
MRSAAKCQISSGSLLAPISQVLAFLLAFSAVLTAQEPVKGGQKKLRGFAVYSLTTSRQLFAATDLNGDDRIRFFEAQKAMFQARDARGFRRFDTDRDGVISFREFDARFQEICKQGLELHLQAPALLRLARGIDTPKPSAIPVQRFFADLDRNKNDKIEFDEWRSFESLLQPMLGKDAAESFRELDSDKSSTLSLPELEVLKPKLERHLSGQRRSAPRRQLRPLPASVQAADRNGNGRIELEELRYALARIHPSLTRHAANLHHRVDQNRDGALDALELRKALALTGQKKSGAAK